MLDKSLFIEGPYQDWDIDVLRNRIDEGYDAVNDILSTHEVPPFNFPSTYFDAHNMIIIASLQTAHYFLLKRIHEESKK